MKNKRNITKILHLFFFLKTVINLLEYFEWNLLRYVFQRSCKVQCYKQIKVCVYCYIICMAFQIDFQIEIA